MDSVPLQRPLLLRNPANPAASHVPHPRWPGDRWDPWIGLVKILVTGPEECRNLGNGGGRIAVAPLRDRFVAAVSDLLG